jgi:hypothetical protein
MSQSLKDRFPELFFDQKTVVQQTPKVTPPSIGQVLAKVLVAHGIQDSSLASDLAGAAEEYFKES